MATGPIVIHDSVSGASFGKYKSWYRSKRIDGVLVLENNPYIYSRTFIKGNRSWSPPLGNEGLAYYCYEPAYKFQQLWPTSYAQAYDRFSDKIWGDAQAALAVDFGERKDTIQMLTGALGRLYKAVKLTKQRRFPEAMRALSAAPPGKRQFSEHFFANWMELRYGWLPTLGSVHSLCEVLAKPIASQSGKKSSGSSNTDAFVYSTTDRWTGELRTWGEWTGHVRISGRVSISDPRLADLNQYGLLNPLEVAWELVPLSFVVDWFVPIGSILADQTRFVGLSFSEGSVGYTIKGVDEVYVYGPPTVEYSTVLKQRVPFTNSPPLPNRLLAGRGLNPKRCMDALALLVGAFRHR